MAINNKFETSLNNPVNKAKADAGYVDWLVKNRRTKKSSPSTEPSRDARPEAPETKTAGGSPAPAAPPKAASDKSRVAPKMTSFQRMKARQFEKEGVAGRSMTRAAAQSKAMETVGGPSLSSLFGLKSKTSYSNAAKKTDKEVPKKAADKSKAELAAWYRAKRQGLAK